jgi:hypothetical protein
VIKVLKRLQRTPPRYLRGFRLQRALPPEARRREHSIAYQLVCRCGSKAGRELGYPLARFNKAYSGPLTLISPLAFSCLGCGRRTEIIDTNIHGCHGEVGYSAVYRGDGHRQAYPYAECKGRGFWVTSLDRTEADLPMAREDGFRGFQLHGTCRECGKMSWIAGFDL